MECVAQKLFAFQFRTIEAKKWCRPFLLLVFQSVSCLVGCATSSSVLVLVLMLCFPFQFVFWFVDSCRAVRPLWLRQPDRAGAARRLAKRLVRSTPSPWRPRENTARGLVRWGDLVTTSGGCFSCNGSIAQEQKDKMDEEFDFLLKPVTPPSVWFLVGRLAYHTMSVQRDGEIVDDLTLSKRKPKR